MSSTSAEPVRIILSLTAGLILTVLPLPEWLEPFRPEWLALILIYWSMSLPAVVGVGIGWSSGILLDVLDSSLLGQHALALSIIVYISLRTHLLVRVFPLFQQALVIGLMLLIYLSIKLWVNGILGEDSDTTLYWASTLTSMAFWPIIVLLMRVLRRGHSVQ